MKYAVRIKTDNTVDLIEVPDRHEWTWYPEQLGCSFFEIVHPKGLDEPYLMIVDEEGALNLERRINFFASWLYRTQDHKCPIYGDALIMMEDGEDIIGLDLDDAEDIREQIESHMHEAFDAVWEAVAQIC